MDTLTPGAIAVWIAIIAVAAVLGSLTARGLRRLVAAPGEPLSQAREELHLRLRRLANAIGLGVSAAVLAAGCTPRLLPSLPLTVTEALLAVVAGLGVLKLARGVSTPWVPPLSPPPCS